MIQLSSRLGDTDLAPLLRVQRGLLLPHARAVFSRLPYLVKVFPEELTAIIPPS